MGILNERDVKMKRESRKKRIIDLIAEPLPKDEEREAFLMVKKALESQFGADLFRGMTEIEVRRKMVEIFGVGS